jgi:polar amino acid transport system substrate-binding protein
MRRSILALATLALVAAACAPEETPPTTTAPTGPTGDPAVTAADCAADAPFVNEGQITLGTDNPAFPPWWQGGETDEHPEWKINDPYTAAGYEAAVAYAVADKLGFSSDEVEWVAVPFNQSFRPGDKPFDFYMAQASYKPKRAENADLSESYFQNANALVSLKDNPIADATSVADLKPYTLAAPIGTTSYDYITDVIQPDNEPGAYDTLNDAIRALEAGQVDGIIVDLYTSFFITAVQIDGGKVVGQFSSTGAAGEDYFSLVLTKGSGLTSCVNLALQELKAEDALAAINEEWLSTASDVPVLA